jgi:flagellar biosynthetic protein FlhB
LLSFLGDDLAFALFRPVQAALESPPSMVATPVAVVAHVRGLFVGLGLPLAAIASAFATGAVIAHQLQVRGLWAPVLITPRLGRLWMRAGDSGLSHRIERFVWSVVKASAVVLAFGWAIRAGWVDVFRLVELEGPALARGTGAIALKLGWVLAAVLGILGAIDYALRYRRFESMLRTTSEEQREDRRVIEGDPATRSQRRQLARAIRADSPELFVGASLIVTGGGGLTLLLGGGPPPRKVSVRTVARGPVGMRLRRLAEAQKIPHVSAPELARRMARRPAPGSTTATELTSELSLLWPKV